MPDTVHQEEHLLNLSTQSPLNAHSLTTLNASSVGAHKDKKTGPSAQQSTKSAIIVKSKGTLTVCKNPRVSPKTS